MKTIHPKSPAVETPDTSTPVTPTTSSVIAIAPPPADALIPPVPTGAVLTNGVQFAGTAPRAIELEALPQAIEDLKRFATYAIVLGTTAPAQAQVLASLVVASQWSAMRVAVQAWDRFSLAQEGLSWQSVRLHMDRLRPAFDLAIVGDPTIATQYPGLASFLGAKKVIAKKSVSTRQANKAAKAKGQDEFHGKVGKKRKTAAQKAALAAQAAAPDAQGTAPVATTVAAATTPVPGTGATHS